MVFGYSSLGLLSFGSWPTGANGSVLVYVVDGVRVDGVAVAVLRPARCQERGSEGLLHAALSFCDALV